MVGRTARPEFPGRAVLLGVLAAVLSLVAPTFLAAQDVVVAGRVVDVESGAPVAGGNVRVLRVGVPGMLREVQGRMSEARTGTDGSFRLSVAPGRYIVIVEGKGYETHRLDGIRAPAETPDWTIALTPAVALLDPLVTSVDGSRTERASAAPMSASVVAASAVPESGAFTPADLVQGLPGVATAWTGLEGRSLVTRGFNGVFSGGPLLLEDGRLAQLPSSRLNSFELISSTLLDVERVELLRGPASVLYGPNAVGGALRIVTSSPIDRPGTTASLTAGERGVFHGAVHEAARLGERSGLRVSGQYFRGREWEMLDEGEAVPRSPDAESGGAQVRLDVRPWDDGEVVFTAGVSRMVSSVLLLRQGPTQATDWSQSFAQARVRKGRLSGQAFANRGDAGDSFILGTGEPVVDRSSVLGARVQYGRVVHPLLDLTGGLDATRTSSETGGTVHGSWESDDGVTEVGGYVYGVSRPTPRIELNGALRLDHHSRFTGAQLSPRVAAVFAATNTTKLRAAFNRGYSYPTPDLLFADWVTDGIPLLDTPGFDVRVVGLPNEDLTFNHTCPGGLDDRCMFSPLLPGIRMPATGAALWDAVLVPLALQSETLQDNLAGMGITPNGFAQIIGRPGPTDMSSRIVRWAGGDTEASFEPASAPTAAAKLRPATTETFEVGLRGTRGSVFSYSVDVHATRISNLVGPPEVVTPTLYLDGPSVEAFLLRRMLHVGVPEGVAERIAERIASTTSSVPLGTLAPDQRDGPDVVLAYRNLGSVSLWGADVGARWQVTPRVTALGSLTYLSDDCFDLDADGICGTAGDVTSNAPRLGGSATVRWSDAVLGVTLGGRLRHAGGFPMNVGAYQGDVAAHTLVDLNGRFLLPWAPGAAIAVTVTNVLDAAHRDFVGAPEIGRLAMVTLQYAF